MKIEPVKAFSGVEVKEIRKSTKMTQVMFAEFLGVSKKAVEAWECGRNNPNGSVCRLLSMLERNPELPEMYFIDINKE